MTTTWRGSVYARGRKLWVSFKQHGEWRDKPTPFYVGQEAQARDLLDQMRRQLAAGEEIADDGAPITVKRYGTLWLHESGRPQDDDSHLRIHIFPALGAMVLAEVRPRHIKALLDTMAVKGRAPRTRRNVYSTLRSLFHSAQMKDLIVASPCILTDADYGTVEDGEKFDREKAVFTREEVGRLITDERVPLDRRVSTRSCSWRRSGTARRPP